ncbi:MAG TPA: TetR/AcrR family transcriptional regulator [Steroidobacteraceae bacterium]|nr:TetR/AcrR family transcriptional regulator [Steroidobacteraceae bacterium]
MPPTLSGAGHPGKTPKQARSKARVSRILESVSKLIERHGVIGTTMSAVAESAGIPIGSLYQFFPNKSALIHRLYLDRLQKYHAPAMKALDDATSPGAFARALKEMMMTIYLGVRGDPLMHDVWGGMQVDREIRRLHNEDNEFYSDLLYRMAANSGSPIASETLRVRAVVINEMADAVLLRAISLSEPRALVLIREITEVAIRELGFSAEAAALSRAW